MGRMSARGEDEAHGDVSRAAAQPAHGHVTRVRFVREGHSKVGMSARGKDERTW